MSSGYVFIKKSGPLVGEVPLSGAKNAVLAIMASLILTRGKSILQNVPAIADVYEMITILESLGAHISFEAAANHLEVDTTDLQQHGLAQDAVKKFRASLLIVGPLLARFKTVQIAMPGGDAIGARPIDYHIKNFKKLGALVVQDGEYLQVSVDHLKNQRLVLDYPSVGATENLMMALVLTDGESWIVNAALEPEVLDLITVLQKMGADIEIVAPAMLKIRGVKTLYSVRHMIMYDRLEAGSLLVAGAVSGGDIYLPHADAMVLELFLMKLEEMGHEIIVGADGKGIRIKGNKNPKAVSFKTGPYPGFPTDLQALMMAAQLKAAGTCEIVETVFENRFLHVPEMKKFGVNIESFGHSALLTGASELVGTQVIATDIRAACALAIVGLAAEGETCVLNGTHHWMRGYETLDAKLRLLGATIELR